jgi:hypothetical protein
MAATKDVEWPGHFKEIYHLLFKEMIMSNIPCHLLIHVWFLATLRGAVSVSVLLQVRLEGLSKIQIAASFVSPRTRQAACPFEYNRACDI